ncbi:SGNH/GDSL hydrolase family protein [Pseudobacteriovorax antillogorgiicola]|uniref:Lysophospholipase L1 n=1 Tax=Pseudobacteriovorax antillogorgiicola TaxID=1513793 RepID=A0A1Y6BHY6_9BACT|nr:SGNH/GDSL hydrolase family protein [Pseudobacteriovorax antillogorgiicola]TCS56505.1 lysophospholipase L1-like esterase [Pseudobacteriovorax antillogorgiicola]SMF04632.1 Lysophospholipase L1 [Pseudobacteriovorax antillogorgiicola]
MLKTVIVSLFAHGLLLTSAAFAEQASSHEIYVEEVSQQDLGDTIILGDSIFALNGEIERRLERNSGQRITSYARNGAEMDDVVQQYYRARARGIPQTVIMNGGGNDVLGNITSCRFLNSRCVNAIEGAIDQGVDLIQLMEDDGVERIVYLGYYYTKFIGGGLDNAIDYAMARIPQICGATNLPCDVVETRRLMNGFGNRIIDGIHPTFRGSRKMADAIWEVLR